MIQNSINHIAFILDGNKRWAKKNKLSKIQGYKKGFDKIKDVVEFSIKNNIKNLTLFALSSENFKRNSINIIYDIIYKNFSTLLSDFEKKKEVKLNIFGNRSDLPDRVNDIFQKSEEITKNNSILNLNIAFNYGFKQEIQNIFNTIKINPKIKSEEIKKLFFLGNIPDPDILIRTGGYKRLSNFIMYNLTYTELFFIDTLWPDFTIAEYEKIIKEFSLIDRKYGL